MGEDLRIEGSQDGAALELVVGEPGCGLACLKRRIGESVVDKEESVKRCTLKEYDKRGA